MRKVILAMVMVAFSKVAAAGFLALDIDENHIYSKVDGESMVCFDSKLSEESVLCDNGMLPLRLEDWVYLHKEKKQIKKNLIYVGSEPIFEGGVMTKIIVYYEPDASLANSGIMMFLSEWSGYFQEWVESVIRSGLGLTDSEQEEPK